jgi:hypothetical protein
MFFLATEYSQILSWQRDGGGVCETCFCRKGVRTDQRWAAGVDAGDGQPGSSAMARRSLAVVQPCEFRVSPRREARSYAGRSQPEERHGRAPEVHHIDYRQKNPVRRVFGLNISEPDIFCGAATWSTSSTSPSPRRYPIINSLPKAGCLGLSQRHSAYIGGPMIT